MDRAAGRDHRARSHSEMVALSGHGGHAARRAALDQDARDLRVHDQACARLVRIREPRLDDRLLGADATPEAAVAALPALRATADAARHRIHVPAELDATFLELALARRGIVVFLA